MSRTQEEWKEICRTGIKGGHIPPTGKEETFSEGLGIADFLLSKKIIHDGDHILDIGSGNGNIPIGLAYRDVKINYLGIEPIKECVAFCRTAFESYANYHFQWLDIHNQDYAPKNTKSPLSLQVPLPSGSVDVVSMFSVFTHLGTLEIAAHYISEILRVLKTRGRLLSTWFRSPPNEICDLTRRTVYPEFEIINLLSAMSITHTESGLTSDYNDQWLILSEKK